MKSNKIMISGFEAGDYVEVECDGDKITLTKTTPPEASSKKSLEDIIKDLDHKQRKNKRK